MRDERRRMKDDRNGRKKDKKNKKIGFLREILKIGVDSNSKNVAFIGLICF
jgi:hypothetical protein